MEMNTDNTILHEVLIKAMFKLLKPNEGIYIQIDDGNKLIAYIAVDEFDLENPTFLSIKEVNEVEDFEDGAMVTIENIIN